MPHPPFDASRAVTFDLAKGQVRLDGAPHQVLVPSEALAKLFASASTEARGEFARALGEPLAKRLSRRLGDPTKASLEAVVEHLGGELALLGLGALALERWGRALVFVVDGSPFGEGGDALLAGILEAVLAETTARRPRCVVLDRAETRVRLLVVSEASAEKVRAWLEEGTSFGDVLARLNGPRGEA